VVVDDSAGPARGYGELVRLFLDFREFQQGALSHVWAVESYFRRRLAYFVWI
jgi:hypothetical protein